MLRVERGLGNLYEAALPATRTGPLFNTFSYPTKISPEAIGLYIATHTSKNATVLDPFAGSGTTGIAALLCSDPTPWMLRISRSRGLEPEWGPRHAVLYELSPLGAFVAETLSSPADPTQFAAAAHELIERAQAAQRQLYNAIDPHGQSGQISYTIWSDILQCSRCHAELTFWAAAVQHEPLSLSTEFVCPSCAYVAPLKEIPRRVEHYRDPLTSLSIQRRCRVPVWVAGRTGQSRWERAATPADERSAREVAETAIPFYVPTIPIRWSDLYRSGYHTGISHMHHFYTARNLRAIASLWHHIQLFPARLQPSLRLLVLSYNATHSTLMARAVVKTNQRKLVLTGAQTGVLYVSSLPVEKNVFDGVRRKIATFAKAFDMLRQRTGSVRVVQGSSTALDLPEASIDYAFTDPPFGDFIPYSEVNQINEAWLGQMTEWHEEAIVSNGSGKSVATYEELMRKVFAEVSRVLKPDGSMTLVFHSGRAEVWQAITQAFTAAGFRVSLTGVLDKLQDSFKQVVANVSVKGDPVLLLTRAEREVSLQPSVTSEPSAVVADLMAHAENQDNPAEQTPERLYSRYVGRCLATGTQVAIDAKTFYKIVRGRHGAE